MQGVPGETSPIEETVLLTFPKPLGFSFRTYDQSGDENDPHTEKERRNYLGCQSTFRINHSHTLQWSAAEGAAAEVTMTSAAASNYGESLC